MSNTLTFRTVLPLISALTVIGSGSPTVAQGTEERRIMVSDIAVSTPSGAALLDARIKMAIQQVCGDADIRDFAARADLKRCRAETSAGAARQVQDFLASRARFRTASVPTAAPDQSANP